MAAWVNSTEETAPVRRAVMTSVSDPSSQSGLATVYHLMIVRACDTRHLLATVVVLDGVTHRLKSQWIAVEIDMLEHWLKSLQRG